MSDTFPVLMGERGRVVVPAELRARFRLQPGDPLLMVDTPRGIVLTTREHVRQLVRADLAGPSLVEDLIAERRRTADEEDR